MDDIILISITEEQLTGLIKKAISEEISKKSEKDILSTTEACEYLDISRSYLNKLKSENRIPFKKLGKRIFYSRKELTESLKNSGLYDKQKKIGAPNE